MQMNQMPPMSPEVRLKVLNIIWIFLLASLVPLGIIIFYLTPPPSPDAVPVDNTMFIQVMGAAAVMAGVMSFILPKFFMDLPMLRQYQPGMASPEYVAGSRYFTGWLIQQALRESIATFGFLLANVAHDPSFFLYFGGASLVLQIMGKPSAEKLNELTQKARMQWQSSSR